MPIIIEMINDHTNSTNTTTTTITTNAAAADHNSMDVNRSSSSLDKFISMSESIMNQQEPVCSAEVDRLLEINVETSDFIQQNGNPSSNARGNNSFANINLPKSSVILLSPLSGNKIERKRIYTHQNKLNPIIHKNITIMKSKAAAADAAAALKSSLQK